ncbi:MAG: hypothetical protein JW820_15320, partial [Spirochaetales bacterium]|nr:hypothetical protein [Spirochaetales bacterium]
MEADLVSTELSRLGSFDPAAWTVSRDGQGLYWARCAPRVLGALDADTGRIEARIPLPYRVYNHVMAAGGLLYVSHHTLTAQGFTVSVVDPGARRLVGEIRGISGLRTGLAAAGDAVFMTTVDVASPASLHLFRIDTVTNQLTELRRAQAAGSRWLLAGQGETLLLAASASAANGEEASLELLDPGSGRTLRAQAAAVLAPGAGLLGEPLVGAEEILVPIQDSQGRWTLLCLDPDTLTRRDLLPLSYSVQRIVGKHGSMLAYLDGPEPAFGPGMSLHFYDL